MLLNTKFLLVDDDADDADIFCEVLSSIAAGLTCHTVENGMGLFEFLSEAQNSKPDVIFLDINMPIMDGWEYLKRLKIDTAYRNIPAIMYSTSSAKRDVDKAYSLGAELFLTKPENLHELRKVLEIVATSPQHSLLSHLAGLKSVKTN